MWRLLRVAILNFTTIGMIDHLKTLSIRRRESSRETSLMEKFRDKGESKAVPFQAIDLPKDKTQHRLLGYPTKCGPRGDESWSALKKALWERMTTRRLLKRRLHMPHGHRLKQMQAIGTVEGESEKWILDSNDEVRVENR
jgi:hypothetical protein